MLSLHSLKPAKNSKKNKKRVGRGNASGHGTYSTRGLKGQRSRSGGKGGLKLRGLRMNLLNAPKLRGFKSPNKPKLEIKLDALNAICNDGDVVTPQFLIEKGLIKTARYGVKILSNGTFNKKVTIDGCAVSAAAQTKVEVAGGSVKSA